MRIGIVNDSVMATEILRRIVSTNKSYNVIWTAKNGAEAIMYCNSDAPDMILMDLMMPVMNGIESTKRIMKSTPCAILIVTSTVTGHSSEVFKAMGAGALDVVATPIVGPEVQRDSGKELLRKIEIIRKLLANDSPSLNNESKSRKPSAKKRQLKKNYLVAIGCSTGGPHAIIEILKSFPTDINATVVIVQHMDAQFISGLIAWLNNHVALPVNLIKEGDRLNKGHILLPDSQKHLIMRKNCTLGYSTEPIENFYHPSVDVFFNSLVKNWNGGIIGVLLTGMGKDGAQGLLSIKNQGWPTISQDQSTSVVYGMPKAAAKLNAAKKILALKEIGPTIISLLP